MIKCNLQIFPVYEMWSGGERVACGVITEDTKVIKLLLMS